MSKKLFSIDEARALLPMVKELAGQLVDISSEMKDQRDAVEELAARAAENSGSPLGTRYVEYLVVMQQLLEEIQKLGCLVKSADEGLIDFPHLREGREVYLCWKYPEKDIEYWHEVDAGFSGRMPLD